jgi:hypothetical protein
LRRIHATPRFRRALRDAAPRGTPLFDAVLEVLITLSDERVHLVGLGDRVVPHGPRIMGRPVRGTEYVVCYIPVGNEVNVVDLVQMP